MVSNGLWSVTSKKRLPWEGRGREEGGKRDGRGRKKGGRRAGNRAGRKKPASHLLPLVHLTAEDLQAHHLEALQVAYYWRHRYRAARDPSGHSHLHCSGRPVWEPVCT